MSEWLGTAPSAAAWVVLGTILIYASCLIAVRIAGRRTVARLSAFDYVVTIALGSVIATTAVSKETPYLNGVVAIVVLLTLQVSIGALRLKSDLVRRLTDFQPDVIYSAGKLDLPTSPLSAQTTLEEIESKVRRTGLNDWTRVEKIILEPDGSVSVILKSAGSATTTN